MKNAARQSIKTIFTSSKSEAQNPNFETNPNVQNSNIFSLFGLFETSNFEFVSGFGIRISDFPHVSNLSGSSYARLGIL